MLNKLLKHFYFTDSSEVGLLDSLPFSSDKISHAPDSDLQAGSSKFKDILAELSPAQALNVGPGVRPHEEPSIEKSLASASSSTISAVKNTFEIAGKAFLYNGVQGPVTSLAQWVEKSGWDSSAVSQTKFMDAPTSETPWTINWAVQSIAGGIGCLAPYLVASTIVDKGVAVATKSDLIASTISKKAVEKFATDYNPAYFAVKGAVYDGLFHPVDSEHFWRDRLGNTAAGAVNFGIMKGVSNKLMPFEYGTFPANGYNPKLGVNTYESFAAQSIGGAAAGVADYALRSTATGHKMSLSEAIENASENAAFASTMYAGKRFATKVMRVEATRMVTDENKPFIKRPPIEDPTSKMLKIKPGENEVRVDDRVYKSVLSDGKFAVLRDETGLKSKPVESADQVFKSMTDVNKAVGHLREVQTKDIKEILRGMSKEDLDKLFPQTFDEPPKLMIGAEGRVYTVGRVRNVIVVREVPNMIGATLDRMQSPWTPVPDNQNEKKTVPSKGLMVDAVAR